MTEADAVARKHPIAAFSLDALVSGAAKLRPQRLALSQGGVDGSPGALTYEEFDRQIRALSQHFSAIGLVPGERLLILAGAQSQCVVALLAALASGLEPLLVRVGLDGATLAAIAEAEGCVAIAGPTSYGPLQLEETLFEAAARAQTIRLVATLGPGETDGAIDLSPERLQADDQLRVLAASSAVRPRVGTLDARGAPVFHDQGALLAAGLDLVGKAELGARSKLLSTLAPASFAALATGLVASLLSGAPLHLSGLFEGPSFLATVDRDAPTHAVVPSALLPDLAGSGLLASGTFLGIVAVARETGQPAPACGDLLVEVLAVDEATMAVRRLGGPADTPAPRPILSGEILAPVFPVRATEQGRR